MNSSMLKLWKMGCRAPVTLALSTLALVLFCFPGLAQSFDWQRTGDIWLKPIEVLGCHFLHWSSEHLFWDLAMFAVTGYLCERTSRTAYFYTLAMSALAIPLLVAWYHPELNSYRGLSGLDTALFALFITRSGWRAMEEGTPNAAWGCAALWLAMFGKSAYELLTGEVLFVDTENFVPVPIAHITGVVCGSAVAAAQAWRAGPPASPRRINAPFPASTRPA